MGILRLIAALFCLMSQGCVGLLVGSKASTTIKSPYINPTGGDVDCVEEGSPGEEYTAAWLKSNWGAPADVKVVSGGTEELWTYEFERQCWFGVMPMIIIPIPLMVPTGHEKVVFRIENGRVASAKRVEWRRGGAVAGLASPEGPFATSTWISK